MSSSYNERAVPQEVVYTRWPRRRGECSVPIAGVPSAAKIVDEELPDRVDGVEQRSQREREIGVLLHVQCTCVANVRMLK